ncbi:MAG: hypothetical protein AB7T06_10445 [Kofleriaceae bacterium]
MSKLLTTASVVTCPHGGVARLATKNTTTKAGARVLVETDVHDVIGCPFSTGSKYSPCRKITWSAGPRAVTIHGTKVLVASSVGTCKNSEKVVQGTARVMSTQQRADAR